MAQPFETRLATGLRSHAQNCDTLRGLIAETEAECDRQREAQKRLEADATDVLLNPTERDEAAAEGDRARRLAQGYADALDKLNAKLEAKLASDRRQSERAEREGVIAERNDIADRFAAEVPKALAILTGLFSEVEANAARMKAARIYERDAEAEARDVPGNYYRGTAVIERLTSMKIPGWSGQGRAWPLDPGAAQRKVLDEEARRQRLRYEQTKTPEARAQKAAEAAAEEAKWPHYRVSHSKFGFIEVDCRTGTAAILSSDRMVFQMSPEQVAAARAKGVEVEPAGDDDKSSLHAPFAMSTPA